MTFWLVTIAIILVLILFALERGNSIKAAQVEVERERLEAERERHEQEMQIAEEQRDYDIFFATNGYPHRNDSARVSAWGAKRGMTLHEAQEFLLDCIVSEDISRALNEANERRFANLRKHDWQVAHVALAFTPGQRSGQDFRPLHGMIWKDEKEKHFLSLTDLSEFEKSGCSPDFPLKEKSILENTFTIEKPQRSEWDEDAGKFKWVDEE